MGFVKSLFTGTPNTYSPDQQYQELLRQKMSGQGPSLADAQLKNALNQVNQGTAAAMGGVKGINPGVTQRQIALQQGQNAQNLGSQSAALRLQEQLDAMRQMQGLEGLRQQTAGQNAQFQGQVIGGLLQGGGAALGMGMSGGGVAGGAAGGGGTGMLPAPVMFAGGGNVPTAADGPSSALGRWLKGGAGPSAVAPHVEALRKLEAGGPVDFRGGGPVPGQARVAGDSERNDTVPAMVSPGEIVIPRSIAQMADAPERAAEFIRTLQRRSGRSRGFERVARRA